jgi:pyridoxamine 5'-phosphate oxidase-like protein
MFWLSTVRRDGRPHVAPLPAMWLDGKLHFCTGAHEQKAKNIEASPRCVLTTGTNSYRSGLDVVIEGTVARVSDNGVLARLAQMWRDKLDWSSTSVTASSLTASRQEWRWSSRSRHRRSWRSPRLRTARRGTSCDPANSLADVALRVCAPRGMIVKSIFTRFGSLPHFLPTDQSWAGYEVERSVCGCGQIETGASTSPGSSSWMFRAHQRRLGLPSRSHRGNKQDQRRGEQEQCGDRQQYDPAGASARAAGQDGR